MSRARKHLTIKMLQGDVDPPGEGQCIVRALGSRGSNLVEVEFPDGATTLCLLPSKFHKKLWIKRGGFLIIDHMQPDATMAATAAGAAAPSQQQQQQQQQQTAATLGSSAVSGGDASAPSSSGASTGGAAVAGVAAAAAGGAGGGGGGGGGSSGSRGGSKVGGVIASVLYEDQVKALKKMPGVWPAEFGNDGSKDAAAAAAAATAARQEQTGKDVGSNGSGSGSDSDSDDGLPPLEPNTNRRVIEYYESDSSDDDDE